MYLPFESTPAVGCGLYFETTLKNGG